MKVYIELDTKDLKGHKLMSLADLLGVFEEADKSLEKALKEQKERLSQEVLAEVAPEPVKPKRKYKSKRHYRQTSQFRGKDLTESIIGYLKYADMPVKITELVRKLKCRRSTISGHLSKLYKAKLVDKTTTKPRMYFIRKHDGNGI